MTKFVYLSMGEENKGAVALICLLNISFHGKAVFPVALRLPSIQDSFCSENSWSLITISVVKRDARLPEVRGELFIKTALPPPSRGWFLLCQMQVPC